MKTTLPTRLLAGLLALGSLACAPRALAQPTVTIPANNSGGAPDSGQGIVPFSTIFTYVWSSAIYTSAEVGRSGFITEIRYYVESVNNPQPAPVKLYLKQRAAAGFASVVRPDDERNGATLVYSRTLPGSAFVPGRWVSLPLDVPFNYDQASNLQVYVETTSPQATETTTNQKQFRYSTAGPNSAVKFQGGFVPTGGISNSDRPNVQLVFGATTACTAPPVAGTTVLSSPGGFCNVGTVLTLSLTGAATGTGLTYQWQRSADNITYTDIAGATSFGYTTPALSSGPVWFRARLTCGGQSATSVPVRVSENRPAYAALPFAESFESTWLDACNTRDAAGPNWRTRPVSGNPSWRRDNDGASAGWFGGGAYAPAASQGAHSARYHSVTRFIPEEPSQGSLDLFVDLSGAGSKTLTFDYLNPSGSDKLEVLLSTDGGATFGAPLLTLGTTTGFAPQTLTLTATAATSVIRFRGTTVPGPDDLGIDNVRVALVQPVAVPVISSFAPASGPVGTVVTVTGTDFTGATALTLNGVAVTSFTVASPTSLTFTVPAGASSGPIAITTPGGTATSATAFTVSVVTTTATSALPGLRVYPNPVLDRLTVRLAAAGATTVALRDLLGRTVLPARPLPADGLVTLPAGLAPGIYLLEVAQGSTTAIRRLEKR